MWDISYLFPAETDEMFSGKKTSMVLVLKESFLGGGGSLLCPIGLEDFVLDSRHCLNENAQEFVPWP